MDKGHAPNETPLLGAPLLPRRDLFARNDCPPRRAGLYGWFFDTAPGGVPTARCVKDGGWTLLYVGIAPSAPPSNGKAASKATLRSRLRQHFSGTAEGSTLRLTLGCLLAGDLDMTLHAVGPSGRLTFLPEGERRLSRWMEEHARVRWLEDPAPWRLEEDLIGALDLPLNLDGNRNHPFHADLTRIRAEARAGARVSWKQTAQEAAR